MLSWMLVLICVNGIFADRGRLLSLARLTDAWCATQGQDLANWTSITDLNSAACGFLKSWWSATAVKSFYFYVELYSLVTGRPKIHPNQNYLMAACLHPRSTCGCFRLSSCWSYMDSEIVFQSNMPGIFHIRWLFGWCFTELGYYVESLVNYFSILSSAFFPVLASQFRRIDGNPKICKRQSGRRTGEDLLKYFLSRQKHPVQWTLVKIDFKTGQRKTLISANRWC